MLILVILMVLAADQVSKFLIQSHMGEMESIPIILNVFHLTYVKNTGAAFSLLQGKTVVFIAVTFAALALALYFYFRVDKKRIPLRLGIALALGGALGNLIDRLRFGTVVDFLDFRIWPVFNLADCAIVVGVALICWEMLKANLSQPSK